VEVYEPSDPDKRHAELVAKLGALSRGLAQMRTQPTGD